MSLAALAAVTVCGLALVFRHIGIMLMFQRGSFTPESTELVSAVFLGLGPSLVGWSLMEILSRSLFALDRRWPPVVAAFIPVLVNLILTVRLGFNQPLWIGVGASAGTMAGFAALLILAAGSRRRWLPQH